MICPHEGHFTQSPSGTRLLSGGGSMGLRTFWNHDITGAYTSRRACPRAGSERLAPRPLGPGDVVAGALPHGSKLALEIGKCVFTPGEVELGCLDHQQGSRRVVEEEVVIRLVQLPY